MPWLIEHNHFNPPEYLRVSVESHSRGAGSRVTIHFDPDPTPAMHFGRKHDAESFIYLHPSECLNCRPSEHIFIER